MLLSAKRSTLLLDANTGTIDGDPKAAAARALLAAAAERLKVPRQSPGSFVPGDAIPGGRDQLVLTRYPTTDFGVEAGTVLQRFLVLDCLTEAERPAMDKLSEAGITAVTSEMVVFEWLERADSDDFRAILKLLR